MQSTKMFKNGMILVWDKDFNVYRARASSAIGMAINEIPSDEFIASTVRLEMDEYTPYLIQFFEDGKFKFKAIRFDRHEALIKALKEEMSECYL